MDREVKQIILLFDLSAVNHIPTRHTTLTNTSICTAFSSSAQTEAMTCFSLSTPRYSELIDVSFTNGKVKCRQNNEQCLLQIFYLIIAFPKS
jgi:hypothetical protein